MSVLEKISHKFREWRERYYDYKLFHLKPPGFEYLDMERERRKKEMLYPIDRSAPQKYDPLVGPEDVTDLDDVRHRRKYISAVEEMYHVLKTREIYHRNVLDTIRMLRKPPAHLDSPPPPLNDEDIWTAVQQLIKNERYIGYGTPTPYNSPPPRGAKEATYAESVWSNPWEGFRWDADPQVHFHLTEFTLYYFLLCHIIAKSGGWMIAKVHLLIQLIKFGWIPVKETLQWMFLRPVPPKFTVYSKRNVTYLQFRFYNIKFHHSMKLFLSHNLLYRGMLYWFGFCLLHDERHGQKRKSYAPFVSGALFYLFVPGIPAAPAPIDLRFYLFRAPLALLLILLSMTAYTASQLDLLHFHTLAAIRYDGKKTELIKNFLFQPLSYIFKDVWYNIKDIFLPVKRYLKLFAIKKQISEANKYEQARGGLYWSSLEVGDMLEYWTKDKMEPIDIIQLATSSAPPTDVLNNPLAQQVTDGGWAAEHGIELKAKPKNTGPVYNSDVENQLTDAFSAVAHEAEMKIRQGAKEDEEALSELTRYRRRKLPADPAPQPVPDSYQPPETSKLRKMFNNFIETLGFKPPRPVNESKEYLARLPVEHLASFAYPPLDLISERLRARQGLLAKLNQSRVEPLPVNPPPPATPTITPMHTTQEKPLTTSFLDFWRARWQSLEK